MSELTGTRCPGCRHPWETHTLVGCITPTSRINPLSEVATICPCENHGHHLRLFLAPKPMTTTPKGSTS